MALVLAATAGSSSAPSPGCTTSSACSAATNADVLRVGAVRAGGEADQVAEEDGDDLPLLERECRRLLGKRRRAEGTEGKLAWKLLAAARTDRHQSSLGAPDENHTFPKVLLPLAPLVEETAERLRRV